MNELFSTYDLEDLLIALAVSSAMGLLLGIHYRCMARSAYVQNHLGGLLPFLALTVCFIIWVIQDSIALSLGLVGALSIVRFRTAIKEPEELSYIFIAIAIGIGTGAGYSMPTAIAIISILALGTLLQYPFTRGSHKQGCYQLTCNDAQANELIVYVKGRSGLTERSKSFSDGRVTLIIQANGSDEDRDMLEVKLKELDISEWSYSDTTYLAF